MPKKKTVAARRAAQQKAVSVKRALPEREPGFIERVKKNPFGVLLGFIIIGSMVLGLAADIVQSSRPQVLLPTPTLIAYDTPVAPTPSPSPAKAASAPTPLSGVAPSSPTAQPSARTTYAAPPPMTIDQDKSYAATIVTSKGTIKLQLLPKVAPNTVNAFVFLAREGYYNGLTFHRVEDWVVQGGDPTGTGSGGPGYTLKAEFNATKHVPGTLAMARTSDPNSAGSQFYIVKTEASWLDNQYTVFGQTTESLDVVQKLVKGDIMLTVTIEEK